VSKGLIVPVAIGLATAAIVAGCGGGGNDTASLSKAEFVKKANEVCAKTQGQMAAGLKALAVSYHGKEPKGAALAAAQRKFVKTVIAPAKLKEAEQLREMGIPPSDRGRIETITDALEEGIKEAENHPEETVTGEAEPLLRAEKLSREYGLKNC